MLESDRDLCFAALRQMSSALGKKLSPDGLEMYFRMFQRKLVPLSVLKKAIVLALEAERVLPRISTLLAYCDKVRLATATRSLPPGSAELEAGSVCRVCGDTGWDPSFCPGQGHPYYTEDLQRMNTRHSELNECLWVTLKKPHEPHGFVEVCSCRATNPVYQRLHPTKAPSFGSLPETGRL